MGSKSRRRTYAWAAVLVAVLVCCVGYAAHLNGDSLDFSHTDARIVISGSMEGEPRDYPISTIPVKSLVVIHKVNGDSFYSDLRVGDVLTFNYEHPVTYENMVVTHRIIAIDEQPSGYIYTLRGDFVDADDDPTGGSVQYVTSSSGDVIGKVVGTSLWLGKAVIFMSTWTGKVCLVLIPCLILIVAELATLIRNLRAPEDGSDGDPEGQQGEEDPGELFVAATPEPPGYPEFVPHPKASDREGQSGPREG